MTETADCSTHSIKNQCPAQTCVPHLVLLSVGLHVRMAVSKGSVEQMHSIRVHWNDLEKGAERDRQQRTGVDDSIHIYRKE